MSYILDALRKSDQQRRQGASPGLMSIDAGTQEQKPRKFSWMTIAAVLIFAMGITIGWLQPWQAENPPALSKAEAPPPLPYPDAAVLQAKPAPPAAANLAPAPLPERQRSEPALPQPVATNPLVLVPPQARPAAANAEAPQASIAKREELPAEIRAGLPNLSVSLHAYSTKPDDRMVIVNGKTLQEGDALAPGLILERITPQDMVFSFQGYRFRQGVQ